MKQSYHFLMILFISCFTTKLYSQSVPSYVPTNGLVGWWGFNGNAQDGSGNGNHGTVNGATLTTDRFGNQNGAYFFNGISNRIAFNLNSINNLFPASTESTSTIWIKTTDLNGPLISMQGNNGIEYDFHIGTLADVVQNPGHYGVLVRDNCCGTGNNSFASNCVDNFWHMLTIVRLSNGILKLYKNATLEFTSSSGQNGSLAFNPLYMTFGANYGWVIGAQNGCMSCNSNDQQHYNGLLDDIGIWNRALTQQEITNLYLAQSGITLPQVNSCENDTMEVAIANPALNGVANAALRMTYSADSLTYVGSSNLNPAFNGMVVNGGNGVVTLDWNTSTNQNIAAGNMVNLRFRVNGSSALTWDTLVYPSEFSDVNFNVVPQTFQSGGMTNSTLRYTWQRQICQGQTLQLGGQTLSTGGNYQVVLPGSGSDCDTLVNLTLSVLPTQTSISATTCSNQPYSFDGQNLNVSGVYRDTLINVLGCDSFVTLNLTVRPAYSQTISVVKCLGTSYNFGNQVLTTSGTYTNTFSTVGGCDSVFQLNLTFADSIRIVAQDGLSGFCPGGSLRRPGRIVSSSKRRLGRNDK